MNKEIVNLKKEIKSLIKDYKKIAPKKEKMKLNSISILLFTCNDLKTLKSIKHKFKLLLKRNSQVS